jgi:hypothetical protein
MQAHPPQQQLAVAAIRQQLHGAALRIGQTVAIGAAAGLVVSMVFSADDPATSA